LRAELGLSVLGWGDPCQQAGCGKAAAGCRSPRVEAPFFETSIHDLLSLPRTENSGHREFWSGKDFLFDLRSLVGNRLAEIILRLEAE